MKHLVILSGDEVEKILAGGSKFLLRFFKKRPEFFNSLSIGDTIFFRLKKGEVLGQFEVGKIIKIEGFEIGDWRMVREFSGINLPESEFKELALMNKYLLIIGISKLEQLIASPIEIEKSRKEWIILVD